MNQKGLSMKEKLKSVLFVIAVVAGVVVFGAWYYLDGTDTLDPNVYVEAENTLKELDKTKDAARDCAGLLRMEEDYMGAMIAAEADPAVSDAQKVINEQKRKKVWAQYNVHRPECEPKIVEYEGNMEKYLGLYEQIKNADKPRFVKLLEKNQKKSDYPAFKLEYALEYATKSDRFVSPE